ncbi:hypothetical protein LP417_08910 [Polaromonas sp. P1-6]|nr:hypothetical protein LP417_08910 [Polaromonas sp. P1-6]
MNRFLRNLSPSEQVGLLFVIVFGLLALISVAAFIMTLKDQHEDDLHSQKLKEFNGLLSTSWLMCTVFWVGWALGETVATVLFGLVAFSRCANSSPCRQPAKATTAAWCWPFCGAAGAVCPGHHAAFPIW